MAKAGRPPVGEKAKRAVIVVRATEEFRSKIDEAANAAGRSMSQEIELRLEKSFWTDAELGGVRTARILKLVAGAITHIEQRRGKSWFDDPETAAEAAAAATRIIRAFGAGDDSTEQERLAVRLGTVLAAAMVDNVEKEKAKKEKSSGENG